MEYFIGGFLVTFGAGCMAYVFRMLNIQQNEAQQAFNVQSTKNAILIEKVRTDQFVREKEAESILQKEINKGIALQRDCQMIQDGRSPIEY